ncbi:MAG: hypothetical protein Q7R96_05555 [Nanoarchaeota archaeon]|nr:hypothetical protein [Nanoarchaeota archaeon]
MFKSFIAVLWFFEGHTLKIERIQTHQELESFYWDSIVPATVQ